MMSQLRLLKKTHDESCDGRIFINNVCKECGQLVDHSGHIEIGVSDKIPLKGQ